MILATRCNACETVFRVVRDQLRVSDGWVRCGHCQAVFNATDDLFELEEAGTPAAAADTHDDHLAQRVIDELAADRRRWRADADALPVSWTTHPAAGLDDVVTPSRAAASPSESAASTIVEDEGPLTAQVDADGDAAFASDETAAPVLPPLEDDRPAAIVQWHDSTGQAPLAAGADAPATPATILAAHPDAAPALPGFVRRADRAAFWRRTPVRLALAAAAALLGAALLAQIGHAAHDRLAAHWPTLEPALAALCQVSGCRIEPLKQIDRLSVDSAGLTLVEGAPLYRLQVVLRNRADTALGVPALELSLEDAQGVLVSRRVLQPGDLGLDSAVVAAGAQMPIAVTLAARDRRIVGYHVELFYP